MSIFLLMHIVLLLLTIVFKLTNFAIRNMTNLQKYISELDEFNIALTFLEPVFRVFRT